MQYSWWSPFYLHCCRISPPQKGGIECSCWILRSLPCGRPAMMPGRCFASIMSKIVFFALGRVACWCFTLVLRCFLVSPRNWIYLTRRGWWSFIHKMPWKAKAQINCQMFSDSRDRNGWNTPIKKKQLGEGIGCLARDYSLRPISWHQISQRIMELHEWVTQVWWQSFFYDAIDTYFPSPTMAHSQRLVECCDGLMQGILQQHAPIRTWILGSLERSTWICSYHYFLNDTFRIWLQEHF